MYIIKALNKNCSELMYILSHNQDLLFSGFNNKAKKKNDIWTQNSKIMSCIMREFNVIWIDKT